MKSLKTKKISEIRCKIEMLAGKGNLIVVNCKLTGGFLFNSAILSGILNKFRDIAAPTLTKLALARGKYNAKIR